MALSFDTNVNNYTLSELLAISGVLDLNREDIMDKTSEYIEKYENNPTISSFFSEVQNQLLKYLDQLEDKDNKEDANLEYEKTQTDNWYDNQALIQTNTVQSDKVTDRKQKVQVYGNEHMPMKKEQLGINNNFSVPVAQDSLNPNLENITTRFINLDSQFRQSSNSFENTSSDYTLDLSDPLPNVLSMRLYSYQIPYSWYTIDESYGNTCFWITDGDTNISISIDSGNYNATEFVDALNTSFTSAGFTFSNTTPQNSPVYYNSKNGKITLNLIGGVYNGNPNFTITTNTIVTFFDYTTRLQCANTDNCVNKGFYINQTLGWIMGYRVPFINVLVRGNVAPAVLDLIGSKYIILVLDDYNQNHINNGLVSITEYSNTLKVPSYFSPDIPYTCSRSTKNTALLENYFNSESNNPSIGLLIADKLDSGYIKYPQVLPSAPRTLTQSQIYTINEIIKNNDKTTNYRSKAPTSNDVFAILPIKTGGSNTGSLIVEFSGSLQDNKRIYFGPVNIDRMRIKLLDDKGNILNLNGADWCVTIICDCLYQY